MSADPDFIWNTCAPNGPTFQKSKRALHGATCRCHFLWVLSFARSLPYPLTTSQVLKPRLLNLKMNQPRFTSVILLQTTHFNLAVCGVKLINFNLMTLALQYKSAQVGPEYNTPSMGWEAHFGWYYALSYRKLWILFHWPLSWHRAVRWIFSPSPTVCILFIDNPCILDKNNKCKCCCFSVVNLKEF